MNIYIDGSCRPSTKLGGYAILVIDDKGHRHIITGTQENVTNNIMELVALIEALKYVKNNQLDKQYEIEIFSDSQYVVKGVNEWWTKWKANGYRNTSGLIKNLELWKEVEPLTNAVKCRLTWVKGHSVNIEHNEVDRIVYNLTAAKNE